MGEFRVTDEPVFVIGSPRSGTSVLHWSLARHPELWGSEESDFLVELAEAVPRVHAAGTHRGERHWLVRQRVSPAELAAHVGLGINALYTERAGGKRWLEQTPGYTLHADSLVALFPGARFLHIVRDGRQVVHSIRGLMRVSHRQACKSWRRFVAAALAFECGPHAARVLRVRYEGLVTDTESTLAGVFAWLGLEPCPASVAFVRERPPLNATPGTEHESSLDKLAPRWHAWSRGQRRTFHRIAGALLAELGYAADAGWTEG